MLFAISYGIGTAAFLSLVLLTLLNKRPHGFGIRVLIVCIITTIWSATAALEPWWSAGVASVLESVSLTGWLLLISSILGASRNIDKSSGQVRLLLVLAGVIGLINIVNDLRFVFSAHAGAFASSQVLARVAMAVLGILVIENLYRNTSSARRWHVFPFCIALGTLFSYNLFVFCEAVVLRHADPTLLAGRGIVLALIVPPLALTMVRNPGWNVEVHVSRNVIFHGATLTGAGFFLVVAAGVSGFIGHMPGQWAVISKIAFFCASVILLLAVLSAESFRSRVRRLIAENFFSSRYDYRIEWLRSIATLSATDAGEPLAVRSIRAIADAVDSPGGALWLEEDKGHYSVSQVLNLKLDWTATEQPSSQFVAGFRGGEVVQDLTKTGLFQLKWALDTALWVAVPLVKIDRLIGFVVLAPPRAPTPLNWESFDLLLAIGQQAAGFLAEERATHALLESRALVDYSKRFSFIVHDIKNVAGQLGLMVANIKKFGDQAEFREDLISGIENSVKRLNDLLEKLRPDAVQRETCGIVNPAKVIEEVVDEFRGGVVPLDIMIAVPGIRVNIAPSALHAILTHLIKNAIDASTPGNGVRVELRKEEGRVLIDIIDKGCGMTADFIRHNLFTPLRSTKMQGHGIGAFQARDLARAAGGEIDVVSVIGRGTTMRVILPEMSDPALESLGQSVTCQ